jgi:hypothetical protein
LLSPASDTTVPPLAAEPTLVTLDDAEAGHQHVSIYVRPLLHARPVN